ncbi:MAG: outer membrane lipoprotein-sorting protein [Gemmatimonas sp.]|nr:outer membrane lipoprotein-sorting protein [Gemmatimonas sp.]
MNHTFGTLLLTAAMLSAGCDSQEGESVSRTETDQDSAVAVGSDSTPAGANGMEIAGNGSPDEPAAGQSVPSAADAGPDSPSPNVPDDPSSGDDPPAPESSASPELEPVEGVEANDILERAEQAYSAVRSMEADFVQQVYVPLLESTIESHGKMYHRPPDRFLMRFTDPEGDVLVADGQYAWMYYPSNDPQQVMRAPLGQGGQQVDLQREFLSDATDRFSAMRTGSETVGGRETHALTLRPRSPSQYHEVKLWVDAESFLVRRFEITETNESVRTVELTDLQPNVTLADSLFQFTPPPGAQVIEP